MESQRGRGLLPHVPSSSHGAAVATSGALDPTESPPYKAQVGSHCPQKTFPNLLLPSARVMSPCDALQHHLRPS